MYIDNDKFAKIVDALTAGDIDYKAVALAVLKSNPDVFAAALEVASRPAPVEAYEREIIRHVRAENMVSAIKELRNRTGMGLKESKDIVDTVRTQLHFNGRLHYTPQSLYEPLLNTEQRAYAARLLEVDKLV